MLAGYIGGYQFYHDAIRTRLAPIFSENRINARSRSMMIGDGTEYHQTRQLAEKLGLLANDRFLMSPRVPQSDVPGILAALDVAVLPGSTDIICPIKCAGVHGGRVAHGLARFSQSIVKLSPG